ncbi:cytochrome c oxidase subunit II [Aureimonas sp. AU22]|uniref:cytochrome c oxidase subunit II n=1 Tax=Aureimonas sp. AU22 TaxID=1638162 RepID=UPI000B0AEDFB|nr:cytochrome c oxidase subunit II [Aureimonas sp. AU22]
MICRFVPLLTLTALGGCSGVQSVVAPGGRQAADLNDLFVLMLVVCGTMYALVLGFLGWSLWRRHRPIAAGETAVEPSDRGLSRSLGAWAALIVVGLSVLITASFLTDRSLAERSREETLTIRVTGHQWWWRIEYPAPSGQGTVETANELRVPVGRTARIELASGDVIHSFWVPNLAGKTDAIPGRANALSLTPTRTGWFRGQCAEYCGTQHAHMALDVNVLPKAEFDAWLAGQSDAAADPRGDPVLARGRDHFASGPCAACHTVRGTTAGGRAGPDLTHVASRRSLAAATLPMSRGGLQGWIANPQALKPGTLMPTVPMLPADADAIASYLSSLR